ncbi:PaaI family thioesterase [Anoxybacterium hadale]|uniref:PaaI family thioesterase n=1 Tax=Anoxybacterium hadale TaxID=3408580 RepID=A0ACD1A7N8_9FIRM|nr:PaaI family thioesterase [Clostridiales bacterium]
MSRLNDILEQENFEQDVRELICTFKENSRVSKLMNPELVDFNKTEQTITLGFPVQKYQLNEHDTMHAGFIAAAFDEALGIFASHLSGGKSTVSINISLNYIKPIPKDDTIMITAKATSLGRTLITVSGECRLKSNGLLTNTALATFAIVG